MVDIAAVSVIASASVSVLVAGGTIASNYFSGERQRKHEADLDFERRAWEKKSDALFEVIRVCRGIADLSPEGSKEMLVVQLSNAFLELQETRPAVEAFASPECGNEMSKLLLILREGGADDVAGFEVRIARALKENAIDAQDFDGAARRRNEERQAMAQASAALTVDVAEVRSTAARLIDEARASVRRASD